MFWKNRFDPPSSTCKIIPFNYTKKMLFHLFCKLMCINWVLLDRTALKWILMSETEHFTSTLLGQVLLCTDVKYIEKGIRKMNFTTVTVCLVDYSRKRKPDLLVQLMEIWPPCSRWLFYHINQVKHFNYTLVKAWHCIHRAAGYDSSHCFFFKSLFILFKQCRLIFNFPSYHYCP